LKEKFVKETKNNKFVRLPVIENSNNDFEILDKLKDKYKGSNMARTQKSWISSNKADAGTPRLYKQGCNPNIFKQSYDSSDVIQSILRDSVRGNQGFAKL